MQLSKTESKYRTKIIQEQHLKKINQIWLDNYCKDISYKDFYLSGTKPPVINNVIKATADMTKELKKLAYKTAEQAVKAVSEFMQALNEVI